MGAGKWGLKQEKGWEQGSVIGDGGDKTTPKLGRGRSHLRGQHWGSAFLVPRSSLGVPCKPEHPPRAWKFEQNPREAGRGGGRGVFHGCLTLQCVDITNFGILFLLPKFPTPKIELCPVPVFQEVPAVSFFCREDVIFLYLLAGQ